MRPISSGVSAKSKMSMFSAMRRGSDDFGIAMFIGCWMCQRSTICAGVLPLSRGDLGDDRFVEQLALAERRIGGDRDAVLRAGGEDVALVEIGMVLDLVRDDRLVRMTHRLLDEVAAKNC